LLQESNANYKLSYKTGWGNTENGDALGWAIGWIEENQHAYFFVLNVEGPHETDMITVAQKHFEWDT
jgi:beta-lactamase class D